MYKILLVDDDIWIRTQIKTNYKLSEFGFEICGEADDGEKGLQLALQLNPDIIITDMNMPNMNGIRLIERLNELLPHVQIIVISSYDDFDYVSKSLKLKAVDYLLKHNLSQEILIKTLNTCVEAIRQSKALSYDQNGSGTSQISDTVQQRKAYLLELIAGKDPADLIADQFEMNNARLIMVELDNYSILEKKYSDYELTTLLNTITSIIENVLQKTNESIVERIYKGRFVILLSFGSINSQLYMIESTARIIDAIRRSLRNYMNITACYAISGIFKSNEQVYQSHKDMVQLMKQRFYTGIDSVLSEDWREHKTEHFFTLDQNDELQIVAALQDENSDRCIQLLKNLFEKLKTNAADPTSCKIISMELISIAKKKLSSLGLDTSIIDMQDDLWHSIFNDGTLQDMALIVIKLYQEVFREIDKSKDQTSYSVHTRNAISYIKCNYMQPISLSDVAEAIALNKSYLSRVFKDDTGMGFSDYLNGYRVKQAQKLILEGKLQIKDISGQVGFNHDTYFFKVFKKYTGETPQTFENSSRLNN